MSEQVLRGENAMERSRTRTIVQVAMLGAVAGVLMNFEFPLPFLAPSFYQMDFSEIPVLIGSFAMGPLAGVLVELMAVFLADQRLDIRFARMRQVSDCADSGLDQFLFGCFSEEQQLAYRKRPHFFGDFFWEQSVYFVWFF